MSSDVDTTDTVVEAATAQPPPARRAGLPIWALLVIALVAVGLGFLVASLIANIAGKKYESTTPTYVPVVQLDDTTQYDPAVWGRNFPNEYNGWAATAEFSPSLRQTIKYSIDDPKAAANPAGLNTDPAGANPAVKNALPADTDQMERGGWVTPEKIVQDPRLVTIWQGYAFAIDYRHLRGHAYNLADQRNTLRVETPPKAQPATCANCHISLPGLLSVLGNGTIDNPVHITNYAPNDPDMTAAWDAMNSMKYLAPDPNDPTKAAIDKTDPNGPTGLYGYAMKAGMDKPVGCVDCHDPKTMELRVTRPALIYGLAAEKASEGIQGYDVNRDATTQEMRTYVCAQCHVEYYFTPAPPAGQDLPAGAPKPNTLTFPWKYGLTVDDAYDYYMNPENFPATGTAFTDFVSARTGAAVAKAQHPEFEAWSQGVHAANGVTCADCHMAYQRVGHQKVSDHDVRSPMDNVNATCGTCHGASVDALTARVTAIQDRFVVGRDAAMDSLVQLINAIADAKANGTATEDQIAAALPYQSKASFYADYGFSENSYGFHAPDYFQSIFAKSLDASRQGLLVLNGVDPATLAPSDQTVANQDAAKKSGS